MSASIIRFDYQGLPVRFDAEGWIYATPIAERFGKHLRHWLDNAETLDYVRALDELLTGGGSKILDVRKSGYVKTSRARADRGGGTWLHPKLAVAFARWLDAKFAVWCDMQIDDLLHGTQTQTKSAMQALDEAAALMEADKAIASKCAIGLARWKKARKEHIKAIETATRRAQLLLGF